MKKKIEIEIPDGKRAEWVNGVLTLVDDDVTERIKTLEDACNALGDNHPLVSQCYRAIAAFKYEPMLENLIAYTKLRVICAALNEGWEPTLDGEGYRYYIWFYIYTKRNMRNLMRRKKHTVSLCGRTAMRSRMAVSCLRARITLGRTCSRATACGWP